MESSSCFTEKKRIRGKDILRMDGLLPPTRRLPVCNAVTSTSDKKKEKKWSIGRIFKRRSSIRDDDSSSNNEEIVYCKRERKHSSKVNEQSDGIVLHPVKTIQNAICERHTESIKLVPENNIVRSIESLNVQRDSLQSRSSDGSLEGLVRKIRKSKMKARVEAKRDQLCPDSSSDEDSRISNNSLAKPQSDDHSQSVCKTNSYNRRTRAARTKRYIKRLFKEDVDIDDRDQINYKRNSLEYFEEREGIAKPSDAPRPLTHPRRSTTHSNYAISTHKPIILNSQDIIGSTRSSENRSYDNQAEYSTHRDLTDMNENNFSEKKIGSRWTVEEPNGRSTSTFAKDIDHRQDSTVEQRTIPRSPNPPDPPPRDPRRVPAYTCHSFPFNGRGQKKKHIDGYANSSTKQRLDWIGTRAYSSSEEMAHGDVIKAESRLVPLFESNNTNIRPGEYTNNKYRSMYCDNSNDSERNACRSRRLDELEASKCRRKNNRNNQLSSTVNERDEGTKQIGLSTNCERNSIYGRIVTRDTRSSSERSKNLSTNSDGTEVAVKGKNDQTINMETKKEEEEEEGEEEEEEGEGEEEEEEEVEEELAARERKRSSKNLEEAISELEAIYNSLRLGDEELLDRAERRSMEEFCLRRGQVEDEPTTPNRSDSPDRLKDDMAYRRMHPAERPTSLSDIGQSSLSNISYLIASPVLSRRVNALDGPKVPSGNTAMTRRDEPDVTRDDVVFRSIYRANNTLKVVEPQPPFGIPLGPVTTATESDYLHTVPNKSNPARSPYIPRCEPDIVTDDLAFRTLRKDATNAMKSNDVDNETNGTSESVNREFPAKKKRAVRSLSANLYGLINQERIHLRRQPSLREIHNDIDTIVEGNYKFVGKPEHFRRVVSDGELSDQGNVRWCGERYTKKTTFDINGNHPDSGPCRKILRVYVSPSTTMQRSPSDSKSREEIPTSTFASATRRTSSGDVGLDLWKANREESSSSATKKSTDSDFTAYSRLCQDLVDIIKGTYDADVRAKSPEDATESPGSGHECKIEIEPLIMELRNELADDDSKRSECPSESFAKESKEMEIEECIDLKLDEVNNVEMEDDKLDYYLRLANENVKMIAEAFSSVADHLRDGLDVRDDSSSRLRTDYDTTGGSSSRSSSLFVEVDDSENGRSRENSSMSSKNEFSRDSAAEVASPNVSVEKLQVPNPKESSIKRRSDIEVDLNKAVEDLQLAAASLSGSMQEMEELEVQLARLNENRLFIEEGKRANEKDDEERKPFVTEKWKDVVSELAVEGDEKNGEKEKEAMEPLDARDDDNGRVLAVREGETNNICEVIDCAAYYENQQLAREMEMRVPYVTNIITLTITEYSMVLLACLLALLLAIVAAS